jgi:alginate O-acetyltransferase complex protein AlgI
MKLVIADRLAIFVDLVYARPDHYHPFVLWSAAACFAAQIYMDFAGYASIAIGTARLFGINLVENFNSPLAARDISDFWARWHMSLTTWLRDYVYIGMGGSQKGSVRTAFNGMFVLVLCGLWHGADWHFVGWGAYQAVWMTCLQASRARRRYLRKSHAQERGLRPLPWMLITLTLTIIGGVLFRAPSLPYAGSYYMAMFGIGSNFSAPVEWYVWIFLLITFGVVLCDYLRAYVPAITDRWRRVHWMIHAVGYSALSAITLLGAVNFGAPYIYFQF